MYLAVSIYTNIVPEMEGFVLKEKGIRWAVWTRDATNDAIIATRGTSVGKPDFSKDLKDDAVIAGIAFKSQCDLSLVKEVQPVVPKYLSYNVVFVGHSLGGSAAMCLGEKYPTSRVISFNGGAPFSKPKRTGPGPSRATHYHVEGDIVSSHMDPKAANVIRIRKLNKPSWGSVYPHGSERMLRNDDPWVFIDANQEQETFQKWALINPKMRVVACNNRIPGSTTGCLFKFI